MLNNRDNSNAQLWFKERAGGTGKGAPCHTFTRCVAVGGALDCSGNFVSENKIVVKKQNDTLTKSEILKMCAKFLQSHQPLQERHTNSATTLTWAKRLKQLQQQPKRRCPQPSSSWLCWHLQYYPRSRLQGVRFDELWLGRCWCWWMWRHWCAF